MSKVTREMMKKVTPQARKMTGLGRPTPGDIPATRGGAVKPKTPMGRRVPRPIESLPVNKKGINALRGARIRKRNP